VFKPDNASPELEKLMEDKDVDEGDRDELRRFAGFLERKKQRAMGNPLQPMPEGMKEWLEGEE
jgi:hypothetical protein